MDRQIVLSGQGRALRLCAAPEPKASLNAAHGTRPSSIGSMAAKTAFEKMKSLPPGSLCEYACGTIKNARANSAKLLGVGENKMVMLSNETEFFLLLAKGLKGSCFPKANFIFSDMECVSFIDLLETGGYRQNFSTWQNYGVLAKDNDGADVSGMASIVTSVPFFSEDDFLGRIESLARLSGKPTVAVLSHVSRIDGRIVDIGKIYAGILKINSGMSENGKIMLVVDGAQAAGTIEIRPEGKCDAYLFTSAKALGAEPCTAVAYASNQVMSILLSGIENRGTVAGQFYHNTDENAFATSKAWASVPEAASLSFVLEGLFYEGIGARKEKLAALKEVAAGILQKIRGVTLHETMSPYMQFFDFHRCRFPFDLATRLQSVGVEIFFNSKKYIQAAPACEYPKGSLEVPSFRVSWRAETREDEFWMLKNALEALA